MTEAARPAPEAASPEDEFLDAALARFVAEFAEGRTPDAADLIGARPDLRDEILDVLAMARDVAPGGAPVAVAHRIAGHDVLREIGRGGMGQVFLAVDRALGRSVALKVLPRRLSGPRSRDRFLREARAVARLSHPLIVPIHAVGEEDGQPWFSMTFVEGRTLAQAVAAARASRVEGVASALSFGAAAGAGSAPPERWRGPWTTAAVRVACDVADALAHAHANGVVHRDVKPSNVMLRPDGFALLLDFGLADVEDEGALTMTRGFLGTPHYASPEQAAGGTDSLDAQSDVFSLGATLYEALTRELPFPGPTPHEVLRRVQTWEPVPPSKLDPSIPPDVETIVLCALEKDRAKRYASAAAFAADLRACLDGRPVKARRAGVLERGLRLVKRNRALTEILVEQQARNEELRSAVLRAERNEAEARAAREDADRARREAEAERDNARDVVKFLRELLASADPTRGARDVRVADLLGGAESGVTEAFEARPAVQIELLDTIARTFSGLGRYSDARRVAERALAAARRVHGDDDPRTCELRDLRAACLAETGEIARAEAEFASLVATGARVFGPDHERTLAWRGARAFALALTGRRDAAERELRDVVARCRVSLGASHTTTVTSEHGLAFAIAQSSPGAPEAGELYARCHAARRAALGPEHPETVQAAGTLAAHLLDTGRVAEAEALQADVARITVDLFGPEHKVALLARHNHARMLRAAGRPTEGLALEEGVVDVWRRVYASTDVRVGVLLRYLSRMRAEAGDTAGAVAAAEEAVAAAARPGAPDGLERALAEAILARARACAGEPAAAEAAALRALDASADLRVRADVEGVLRLLESRGARAPALGARLAR